MWAGLLIRGSIKCAKGLAKGRKCSFLFLVLRDFEPFPVVTGRADEGWKYLYYGLFSQSFVSPGFVNRSSNTCDLRVSALLSGFM